MVRHACYSFVKGYKQVHICRFVRSKTDVDGLMTVFSLPVNESRGPEQQCFPLYRCLFVVVGCCWLLTVSRFDAEGQRHNVADVDSESLSAASCWPWTTPQLIS